MVVSRGFGVVSGLVVGMVVIVVSLDSGDIVVSKMERLKMNAMGMNGLDMKEFEIKGAMRGNGYDIDI
jgi:hypothetical protein